MRLMIDDQQGQVIDATLDSLNTSWKTAVESISKQVRFIHYVQIDGQDLYDGYEQYLINNFEQVQSVNIKTLSVLESINDTEESLDEYLDRFIDISLDLAMHFFGDLTEEDWRTFSSFITGLNWIVNALEFDKVLFQNQGTVIPTYLDVINELGLFINQMEQSLLEQDYVSVGDLIKYEIIPALQVFRSRHSSKE